MSYSTLKKALQLFEEPVSTKKSTQKSTCKYLPIIYFSMNLNKLLKLNTFVVIKSSSRINKFKSKSQRAKSVFKVPNFMKSDAGRSVQKVKEQIKNEKELNLLQLNLQRLHKLDKTSVVNNIATNLVCIFMNSIFYFKINCA